MDLGTIRPGVVIVNDGSRVVSVTERDQKPRRKGLWGWLKELFVRPSVAEKTRTNVLIEDEGGSTERLTAEEREDRDALVAELRESPVPRWNRTDEDPPIHELFFSGEEDWDFPFRYFRAIWSERKRVVVFYAWGLGSMFRAWTMFQPALNGVIRRNQNEIVVVVFAVERYDVELGVTLDHLRKAIWKHFFK
jgi:hypothetical protein